MLKRSIFVAALLSATVGTAFADAQDYILQNRTPIVSEASRVQAPQGVSGAQTLVNGEAYGHNSTFVSQRTRAEVQAEAVAAAQAPNQNLNRSAYVNSQVPASLTGPSTTTRQAASDSRAPM